MRFRIVEHIYKDKLHRFFPEVSYVSQADYQKDKWERNGKEWESCADATKREYINLCGYSNRNFGYTTKEIAEKIIEKYKEKVKEDEKKEIMKTKIYEVD